MKWTKNFPTAADYGKWFFIKQDLDGYSKVDIVEVREDKQSGKLYLCQPCNEGIQAQSDGTMLSLYEDTNRRYNHTSFSGPITLPEGFADYRKQFYNSKTHKLRMSLGMG